jgi:hypothetical protein
LSAKKEKPVAIVEAIGTFVALLAICLIGGTALVWLARWLLGG